MTGRIAWTRRLRVLLAAGAVPSTTLAAVGDFFSPKGGWMLPLALGAIGLAVLTSILLIGTKTVARVSEGDSQLDGWWDGPRVSQLGVWVIAVFSLSALLCGWWSKARAVEGGVLASNIGVLAEAQQQIGLLTGIEDNTRRTAIASEGLQETVKRETSENPRKELSNLGQAWSTGGFLQAINREDSESVQLYLEGGMRAENIALINRVLEHRLWDLLDTFEAHGTTSNKPSCERALSSEYRFLEDRSVPNKIDRRAVRAYQIFCGEHSGLIEKMQVECANDRRAHEIREREYAEQIRLYRSAPNWDMQYYQDQNITCAALGSVLG